MYKLMVDYFQICKFHFIIQMHDQSPKIFQKNPIQEAHKNPPAINNQVCIWPIDESESKRMAYKTASRFPITDNSASRRDTMDPPAARRASSSLFLSIWIYFGGGR